MSDFVKQHQNKGSPLAHKTPKEVLDQVITELGIRPKTSFVVYGFQDTSWQIVQVLENTATGEVVDMPPGHWDVQPAQDPQLTIVTDGVNAIYAVSFFGSQQRQTVSVGLTSPMASGGQVQTPLPAAAAGGAMLASSAGSGDAYSGYGMAPAGPLQASVSKLCGQTCSLCSDQRVHMAHDSSARIMSMYYSRRKMQGARVHV